MEFFLVQTLNGISYGLLLFMLSSGLTLVFSLMGVLNFAHASFYMLGAYLAFQISTKIGFWPGLVIAPLLVGALGMLVAIWLALTRTRIGLVIQAALTHPQTVEALGHNVPRVFMLVFGGGCALAGLAGVIGGNAFVTEPGMAAAVGPIIFVIVVVGGMGSLAGAFIASLLIGCLQTFAVSLDWSLGGIGIAQAAPMLPYLLMVLLLIFRPKGLMGTREG